MIKIAFVSTNYGPLWRPPAESWLRAITYAQRELIRSGRGEICGVGITDRSYTHTADNTLVKDMLADPQFTHLMHVENDMIIPDETILRLLEVNKPIVSGLYFLRRGNGQPCLYKKLVRVAGRDPEQDYTMSPITLFPTEQPFKLNGCPGLGCVLIARSVFEQVPFPWFDLKENGYGSDMYFYTKVRRAGIDVWVHPLVRCGQIEYQEWTFDDYAQRLQDDPGFAAQGGLIGAADFD